jgi:hypothetical protein
MVDLCVIDDPASACVALDPVRSRLLSELRTPVSAATLAGRMRLPRQKVNYHLRTLEKRRLVRVDSKKRWGGLTERRMVATASALVSSYHDESAPGGRRHRLMIGAYPTPLTPAEAKGKETT